MIRLNYEGKEKYDFKGGCGKPGTEILLPLSPRHLLYTKIGDRPPPRGQALALDTTEMIRRFIAEHAFRMIFATSPEESIAKLRPRLVSDALFRQEQEQWRSWHESQTAAERELALNR